jgi:hypothetical protein
MNNSNPELHNIPSTLCALLLVDNSASMLHLKPATERAIEGFLSEQAEQPGLVTVDVVLFNSAYEITHRQFPPEKIKVNLRPHGGTSLYDVAAICIEGFANELDKLPSYEPATQILVAILSDGEDTTSIVHNAASLREIVKAKQAQFQWEFVYLAANQDAILNARKIGIKEDASIRFDADAAGVAEASRAASRFVSDVRRGTRTGFTDTERGAASRRS